MGLDLCLGLAAPICFVLLKRLWLLSSLAKAKAVLAQVQWQPECRCCQALTSQRARALDDLSAQLTKARDESSN